MENRTKKHQIHTRAYVAVWMTLLLLTVITVWVSYHNFGIFNIVVAMGVATIKGSLVCLYFMHLKYDHKVNQVIFVSSFGFLAIFVGLTLSDVHFRSGERGFKPNLPVAATPGFPVRIPVPMAIEKLAKEAKVEK